MILDMFGQIHTRIITYPISLDIRIAHSLNESSFGPLTHNCCTCCVTLKISWWKSRPGRQKTTGVPRFHRTTWEMMDELKQIWLNEIDCSWMWSNIQHPAVAMSVKIWIILTIPNAVEQNQRGFSNHRPLESTTSFRSICFLVKPHVCWSKKVKHTFLAMLVGNTMYSNSISELHILNDGRCWKGTA